MAAASGREARELAHGAVGPAWVVLTGLGSVIAASNAAIRILFAMGSERVLPVSPALLSSRYPPAVAIGGVAVHTVLLGAAIDLPHRAGKFPDSGTSIHTSRRIDRSGRTERPSRCRSTVRT